jgi:predicted MPP superfamily phosphohydrolase
MSRLGQMLPFLAVVLALTTGIHYYLWARLLRDTEAPPLVQRLGLLLLLALALSFPITMIFLRRASLGPLPWISFSWVGVMFFLLVATLTTDMIYVSAKLSGAVDPARRTALRRILSGVAALVAFSAAGIAVGEALRRTRVVDVTVPLKRLPKALDGFTIVQMSDVHVGPTIGHDFVTSLVETVNGLSADLVAITGDLVDGSVNRIGAAVAPLAGLRSRHGTFFVTGNHEYYSGAADWVEALSGMNMRVLRNERVVIEQDGASFDLAGVDDWKSAGLVPGHGADLAGALRGYDRTRELVLLAHQPRQATEAAKMGVGLQLSGHTHGGQLWPFGYLVRLQHRFVAGLERVGDFFIYVSRGTGYWGPPMRLGAPAEITRITLRAAA